VIWSRILQLFHMNDHHIEKTYRMQHLGCYLEGQGHNMTLQQNRVWPKTLLFEVRFYNYFWQTPSLCPIPIRGALPGSDRLLFGLVRFHCRLISIVKSKSKYISYQNQFWPSLLLLCLTPQSVFRSMNWLWSYQSVICVFVHSSNGFSAGFHWEHCFCNDYKNN